MINGEVKETLSKTKWPSPVTQNLSKPGNVKAVIYGAQHPPLAHLSGANGSNFLSKQEKNLEKNLIPPNQHKLLHSGFPDFQKYTDDAWDIIEISDCYENMDRDSPTDSRNRHLHHGTSNYRGTALNNNSGKNPNFEVIPKCHIIGAINDPNPVDSCRDLLNKKLSLSSPKKEIIPTTPASIYPSLDKTHSKTPHKGPGVGKRCSSPKSIRDPQSFHVNHSQNAPTSARINHYQTAAEILRSEQEMLRMEKYSRLMNSEKLDIEELTRLSWSGIPPKYRPLTWKILSHYVPVCYERRKETLERKRREYFAFVDKYYPSRFDDTHKDMYRQIHIDIPRMNPLIDLFQQPTVQNMFERILYIWAMRHPASGYVQGINDLVTPFFVVFLSEYVPAGTSVDSFPVDTLQGNILTYLEADSFWCVSNLLDGIQDNYTFAQPGIQEKVNLLKHLVSRINVPLYNHLRANEVEYLQFAFRWMNNLLMREIPLKCTIRLWDTYLAEPNGFAQFHLYVCVAFLNDWSGEILREKDFQGIMLLVQNLPTKQWGEKEIGLLLAEAFKLKYIFADAPRHLRPQESSNIVSPTYPDLHSANASAGNSSKANYTGGGAVC